MNEPDVFNLKKHELDNEWIDQPRLYHKYAIELAESRSAYEQAKANRDVMEAEIRLDIRQNPGNFGIEKLTEATVSEVLILQKPWQVANSAVLAAKHAMEILQAMVDALEHRKKALEALVSLEQRDYFSKPRAPIGTDSDNRLKEKKRDEAFGGKRK